MIRQCLVILAIGLLSSTCLVNTAIADDTIIKRLETKDTLALERSSSILVSIEYPGFAVKVCEICHKVLERIPLKEAYEKGYLKK